MKSDKPMKPITLDQLCREIAARSTGARRVVVAVAGPPGSGKSTLCAELAVRLGDGAAVVPMDGFHLDNERLVEMGLLHRKGAPETFDADGFVALVRDLGHKAEVSFPLFDRDADRSIADAGRIGAGTRVVLVEGNYLLLNDRPWSDLAPLFDLSVRLDVERAELEARLVQRWLDQGMPPEAARARARDNDLRNADHVDRHSRAPDFVLVAPGGTSGQGDAG